jgi:hypothetical protein
MVKNTYAGSLRGARILNEPAGVESLHNLDDILLRRKALTILRAVSIRQLQNRSKFWAAPVGAQYAEWLYGLFMLGPTLRSLKINETRVEES